MGDISGKATRQPRVGDKARVTGLVNARQYNDSICRIDRWDDAKARFNCTLEGSKVLQVKPENLAVQAEDARSTERGPGRWQWSHGTLQAPSEDWGDYLPETNDHIEAAYLAAEPRVQIALGARSLVIEFDGEGGMCQVDYVHGRVRAVRRVQLARGADLPRCAEARADGDPCCICMEPFNSLQQERALPCGHRFHAMCVDIALEVRAPACPVCRAPVERRFVGCRYEHYDDRNGGAPQGDEG